MESGWPLIRFIAKKEIITNVRNFKTPVVFVIMTLLLLLSAHALAFDYRNRLSNWSINHDRQRDQVMGGGIRYDLSDGSFSHGAGVGRTPAIQPPQIFSTLVKGIDAEMDRTVIVSQRINFSARQDESATSALFDIPDTSFVVKLLVSLFALMFSLDAAPRDKESGMLRAMMAQPIRRHELILSKSLGASISLLAPFALAYFIEITYLHLAYGLLNDLQDFIRAMLIFGLASLYGIVFVHIGLFISTMAARTRIAVTTSLLTWATLVLILPNASVLMAKLLISAPSYNQLNARLRESRRRILMDEAEVNSGGRTARPSRQAMPRIYDIERLETDYYLASKDDQNHRARLFAALSPAGAWAFGSSDLAGTGMDAYKSYLALVRSSRDTMLDALKQGMDLSPQEGGKLLQAAVEKVADSRRRSEPLGASFHSSLIPITSLLAWALLFGLASCWRFERYDVR